MYYLFYKCITMTPKVKTRHRDTVCILCWEPLVLVRQDPPTPAVLLSTCWCQSQHSAAGSSWVKPSTIWAPPPAIKGAESTYCCTCPPGEEINALIRLLFLQTWQLCPFNLSIQTWQPCPPPISIVTGGIAWRRHSYLQRHKLLSSACFSVVGLFVCLFDSP